MKCNEWIKRKDDTFFSPVYFNDRSSSSSSLLLRPPPPASSTSLIVILHTTEFHTRLLSVLIAWRFQTARASTAVVNRRFYSFIFLRPLGKNGGEKNYILVVVEIYRRRWNVNDDVGTLSRSNWSAIFVGFQNRFSLSPWISNANRVIWSKYSNWALSISTKQFSFHETQNCEMINASKYKLKHEIHISTTKLLSSTSLIIFDIHRWQRIWQLKYHKSFDSTVFL